MGISRNGTFTYYGTRVYNDYSCFCTTKNVGVDCVYCKGCHPPFDGSSLELTINTPFIEVRQSKR